MDLYAIMSNTIQPWLKVDLDNSNGSYRHRLFSEKDNIRNSILPQLQSAVAEAHKDAIEDLRSVLDDTLDPITLGDKDPAHGYPYLLHIETLQGYFGEYLAGALAEEFKPFDVEWTVPAYLFRFHVAAFQELARLKQIARPVKKVVGRTGDDCLAFSRNEKEDIDGWLYCESKCLKRHNTGTAAKAHQQLSGFEIEPADLQRLIKILKSKSDKKSQSWCSSLQRFMLGLEKQPKRSDFLTYIADKPSKRRTWLSTEKPASEYTGERSFEAAEVQIKDIPEFVAKVYKKQGT